MNTTLTHPLSHRDRAVLRAVAAGRCEFSGDTDGALVVDGRFLADQFTGPRLTSAGLIDSHRHAGPATLTATGRAMLEAA